ncbi:protein phosphatase 2C domain-containing protein [Nocardiopsis sp. NPDC049922]|uniref:PP2C family protein-serine/threonine phosphatase n=1 Tax=Nocardiopsis sp. NPDC049922 TaxID=3155157 RepID=UPI0033EE3B49
MTAGEVVVTVLTHPGKVRKVNEDRMTLGWTLCGNEMHAPARVSLPLNEPLFLAVADGIGGHTAGEIASNHVCQRLADKGADLKSPSEIPRLLEIINEELTEHANVAEEFAGMGSTIAGLWVSPGNGVHWFNAGDSRVYRLDGHKLIQITEDDSPPRPVGEDGEQEPTNFITQALGGSQADVYPHGGPESGRSWLLCSDGLSDLVRRGEMEKIISEARDDQSAVQALFEAAMAAGGKDNIAIMIARLV